MSNCKICNVELKNKKRIYCSNACKFSDKDYNLSRVSKVKNNEFEKLKCIHCNWETKDINNKSGIITRHLGLHNIQLSENYTKEFTKVIVDKSDYWHCPHCQWKTADIHNKSGCIINHLGNIHNVDISVIINDSILKNLNSKKIKNAIKKEFLLKDEKNRIQCKICNNFFKKLSNSHLIKHNLTPSEYKNRYKIRNTSSEYISDIQSSYTRESNLKRGSSFGNKSSSLELDLSTKLKNNNINYVSPFLYEGRYFDFYIPDINSVIEIDGEAFHKDSLNSLTFQTVNGSVNDFEKNKLMELSKFNFYRIRYVPSKFLFSSIDELRNNLENNKYSPSYAMEYQQKIMDGDYLKKYIVYKGKNKLRKYSSLLLKFIRTFQPNFPYPDLKEDFVKVLRHISVSDLSSVYDESTKTFSNNCSTVGHNYLKHYFKSYWKSSFNGNLSPEKAWADDKTMQEVINYRIGLNDSDEVFDFSLHQLVRGLSARRITVSFFKPTLAATIYKKLLGNVSSPTVLDPCCGFGGRLMGFKSLYPQGTYIGCEPNIETYNELLDMVNRENLTDVRIYNCKFEDYRDTKVVDLTFTSIPYFDLELYSNCIHYDSFDQWKSLFIESLKSCKNCYINCNKDLSTILGWNNNIEYYLKSNTTHFEKTDEFKLEPIVKLS